MFKTLYSQLIVTNCCCCVVKLTGYFHDISRCKMEMDDINVCNEFYWHLVSIRSYMVVNCIRTWRFGLSSWENDK